MSTETKNAVKSTNGMELDLFQFTTPKADAETLVINRRTNDKGILTGMAMTLAKRKDIALKLGVPVKSGDVTAVLREASDTLLLMGLAEMQRGMNEGKLTGARFAKSKNGRLTLSAVTPEQRVVTAEQLEEAFKAMTPAERAEFVSKMNSAVPNGVTMDVDTGAKVKKGNNNSPKAAAKTDEQPEAEVEMEVEPALDNQTAELVEA